MIRGSLVTLGTLVFVLSLFPACQRATSVTPGASRKQTFTAAETKSQLPAEVTVDSLDPSLTRGQTSEEPQVATLGAARFVVAWRAQQQAGRSDILLRIGTEGNMGQPIRVNAASTGVHRDVQLRRISDDEFAVIWWHYLEQPGQVSPKRILKLRRFNTAGKPQPVTVLYAPVGTETTPLLVGFPDGHWVAIASAEVKGRQRLVAQRVAGSGERKSFSLEPSRHYRHFFHPRAAVIDTDRAVVIWWAANGRHGSLRGRVIDASGRPVARTFHVTDQMQSRVFNHHITRLTNGNFVVTWDIHSRGRIQSEVMARLFHRSGHPLRAAFFVNSYRKGHQIRPQVATLENGGFVITWQSNGQDGDGGGIYLQRFQPNGRKAGGESKVPLESRGHQTTPRIATWRDGQIVVLWHTRRGPGFLNYRVIKPFRFPM